MEVEHKEDYSDDDLPDFISYDSTSSEEDFDTDSEKEEESDHSDGEIEWAKPRSWARQVRKNPELATFAQPWTVPARRASINDLHTDLPEQQPSFNIEPNGDLPFALMFLDALPLEAFWRDIMVRETRRYAEQNNATPGRRDGRRSWDEPKMNTVSNWLRVTAAIIMRGLVPASTDAKFFATEVHQVGDVKFSRPGAKKVCKIDINTYEQLLRYQHLVDASARAAREAADHDKAWPVRIFIQKLNDTFLRWFNIGRNNALDEGGLPSRHNWLRIRNPAKPHRYFIEMLMGCCSLTRFCWHFQLNEGIHKIISRADRTRGQSRYMKVDYYQYVYNEEERRIQDNYGAGAAQMMYFSRVLRRFDNDPTMRMCYRIFTDRRWCSLPSMYHAKKKYNVSYTCSVMDGSRFHITNMLPVVKSKDRKLRGKYRSAFINLEGGVRIVCVLWNDSNRCGYASCDLGTEGETTCIRRAGRWQREVPYPHMVAVRERKFRAIDRHDQLRLGKCHFDIICRRKAWPKAYNGGIEILLVNIFIIATASIRFRNITQRAFRWQILLELVTMADRIDARERQQDPTRVCGDDNIVDRYSGLETHHHATWPEYVLEHELEKMKQLMIDNPGRPRPTKRPRRRDQKRIHNGKKVRNPAWYESVCVVCWAAGKTRRTARYCKECSIDPTWTFRTRIGGWADQCQPRLCSDACWTMFHTQRIPGLDFNQRKVRRVRRAAAATNSGGRRAGSIVAQRRETRRRLRPSPAPAPPPADSTSSSPSEPEFDPIDSPPPPPTQTRPSRARRALQRVVQRQQQQSGSRTTTTSRNTASRRRQTSRTTRASTAAAGAPAAGAATRSRARSQRTTRTSTAAAGASAAGAATNVVYEVSSSVLPVPTRRSSRSTRGQTSRYDV